MTKIVFYIKIEIRSSLILFTYILILSIAITALKIRDIVGMYGQRLYSYISLISYPYGDLSAPPI